jgi:hypothetical protein
MTDNGGAIWADPPFNRGPYGTNLGDIWSGEDSPVGKMLMERDGLVMIHEVFRNEKTGEPEERIYNVELSDPDPEMQGLIKSAREGAAKYFEAQAAQN